MTKVFIDGSAGTTGLRIHERLAGRTDLTVITLPDAVRKDTEARRAALNEADIAFLCLPDAAAKESVSFVTNPNTAIIDTSTAHRTATGWTYGFAELDGMRTKIAQSKRVANPGCHASGFIALVAPLVRTGILKRDARLSCFSITGYTGGGKQMIADYESAERPIAFDAPRQYGLGQTHKHLPEMAKICGMENDPIFCPIVSDFACGMEVTVPLFGADLKGTIDDIRDLYASCYNSAVVHYDVCEEAMLAANAFSGRDDMQILVQGNADRILLVSRFDNLGKGASGAAIQNMNILLGVEETTGLCV